MKVFNVRQHQQVFGTFVRIEAKTHLALGVGWCWISWSRVSRVRRLGVPLGSHNSDQCSEDEDLSKSGDNFFSSSSIRPANVVFDSLSYLHVACFEVWMKLYCLIVPCDAYIRKETARVGSSTREYVEMLLAILKWNVGYNFFRWEYCLRMTSWRYTFTFQRREGLVRRYSLDGGSAVGGCGCGGRSGLPLG